MMADQKFNELQKLLEAQLLGPSSNRHELLLLYYEVLTSQRKHFPDELSIELASWEIEDKKYPLVSHLINDVKSDIFSLKILKIKLRLAEEQGLIDDLYLLISLFIINQFEKKIPHIPECVIVLKNKYFNNDFKINLGMLSIYLLLNDLKKSEEIVKEIILTIREKSFNKGLNLKLCAIADVLNVSKNKASLEIYKSYCVLYTEGIKEKSHYKKVIEMIIYFDDFKFQVLVLDLMNKLDLNLESSEYAQVLKDNKDYNFVYLEKYFPHLKSYFLKPKKIILPEKVAFITPDLILSEPIGEESFPPEVDLMDEMQSDLYFNYLKYQTYSFQQLCELVVSFIQSEMPKVALKISGLAHKNASDDQEEMKASYLHLTCLLILRDYRAALDISFQALNKAIKKDDILSFLYAQAEIYIRLREHDRARMILSRIISIDSKYRLAKERLEKLNGN